MPCFLIHVLTASRSLRILLAEGDRQLAAGPHRDVAMHGDVGEHLAPECRQVVVDDGDRREAGIDHFEDVVVFEHLGRFVDDDRRLAARLQLRIEADETLVVDAALCGRTLPGRRGRPPWRSAALPDR